MTDSTSPAALSFQDMDLPPPLLRALAEVGYEAPSPIQAASIPPLLAGRDLLGQAQTGTGKTAAFALPLLARIDSRLRQPQLLVLAPTRELAIQVAEAFQRYARYLPDFHVLPIYGGQSYDIQLRQLKRGVQVVVGTPGRVMDHMRRGTLKLDALKALVLDEADEMLRMGFIDDVNWVLEQTPAGRQVALFSATMPREIRKVAQQHLNEPVEVKIDKRVATAETIRQRYWPVSGLHKLDALTRLLEVEPYDAMLVFVRTKTATVELAEKLEARGHAAEALNGDIPQKLRERTVERLKNGQLDILVATDVVARGLDVARISHVINYDIPHDVEAYIHRIGRTGRAGRSGEAILFVASRERRLLRAIEKTIGQPIEPMQMPTAADINQQRLQRFKQKVRDALAEDSNEAFYPLLTELQEEDGVEPLEIAAALARLLQGKEPLLLAERREPAARAEKRSRRSDKRPRPPSSQALPLKGHPEVEMERYRVEVGHAHGVKPGNLVGAIANEADLESAYIGHIEIYDDFSTVDLPAGMPKETFRALQRAWVCQQRLNISRLGAGPRPAGPKPAGPKTGKKAKKKAREKTVKGKPGTAGKTRRATP
ncbi:DEAD/DEAH box helicase [Thiohalobacter sp. IOR34]|uniref:DEAD/DEAH box helicase n=1 Tax=Thiohalobacter sp. IOR34 TaxID=3057176 RepID=UPI0025B16FCA|nr:DEAD/DEAH box helicase [Thiohalobacter sp. IOR34]WJW74813.1 DEAD/DEAH box helicase [Thiohalobacter sp. IOR34]